MPISVTLATDKDVYSSGETVTVTYLVTGANGRVITVTGQATVDGTVYPAETIVNISSTRSYGQPTGTGLTFVVTSNPAIWTATA